MIMDLVVSLALALGNWLCDQIDAGWQNLMASSFGDALKWFYRLDEWLPVADLASMLGIVGAMVGIMWLWKLGSKVIDWLPFT